nr:hypothetical protein [Tanacetum cinerariifolium]
MVKIYTDKNVADLLTKAFDSAQQQVNVLLHFKALSEEHVDLVYAHDSCKDVKARYMEYKKELVIVQERYAIEAGKGEMVRRQIINDYLLTFEHCLHQSNEYKQSLGEVFSLAICKGFIDRISIGRKDPYIHAILKATPNVDLASFDIVMDKYEKLFDKRYPYVDKVARMYLLDPSGLQNVMLDETGPTPGGGPRDTPTASYA